MSKHLHELSFLLMFRHQGKSDLLNVLNMSVRIHIGCYKNQSDLFNSDQENKPQLCHIIFNREITKKEEIKKE